MGAANDSRPYLLHLLLRPFKALARIVVSRLVRRLSRRFADEIAPFVELQSRLDKLSGKVDTFHWDHVALTRRLAAIEDHIDRLLRQDAAADSAAETGELQSVVPFAPPDSCRTAGEINAPTFKLERIG